VAGKSEKQPVARLSYMQIGTAKFQTNFALRNFPFDTQVLTIRLFSDCSADDVRLVRNMEEKKASLLAALAFQNEAHEYEMSKILWLHTEFKGKKESSSATPRCALNIDVHIRRRSLFWLLNVWFPICTFTGLSFCSFVVEVTNVTARLAITLTILLTLVAYRFAMMNTLPRISYLNWMDTYFQVSFFVVFSVTVHAVALAVRAEETFAYLLPDGTNTWQNPVPSYQTSQATVGWVISVIWAVLNICCVGVLLFMHHRGPKAWLFGDKKETTLWVGLSESDGWGKINFDDAKGKIERLPKTLGEAICATLEIGQLVKDGTHQNGSKLTHYRLFRSTRSKTTYRPLQFGAETGVEAIRLPSDRGRMFKVVVPPAGSTVRGSVHVPPAQRQWLLLEFSNEEFARAARLVIHKAFDSQTLKTDEWRLELAANARHGLEEVKKALRDLAGPECTTVESKPRAVCEVALPEYKFTSKKPESSSHRDLANTASVRLAGAVSVTMN
jgi:hypothetical protein